MPTKIDEEEKVRQLIMIVQVDRIERLVVAMARGLADDWRLSTSPHSGLMRPHIDRIEKILQETTTVREVEEMTRTQDIKRLAQTRPEDLPRHFAESDIIQPEPRIIQPSKRLPQRTKKRPKKRKRK